MGAGFTSSGVSNGLSLAAPTPTPTAEGDESDSSLIDHKVA